MKSEGPNTKGGKINHCFSRLTGRISKSDGHVSPCLSQAEGGGASQPPGSSGDQYRFANKRLSSSMRHRGIFYAGPVCPSESV